MQLSIETCKDCFRHTLNIPKSLKCCYESALRTRVCFCHWFFMKKKLEIDCQLFHINHQNLLSNNVNLFHNIRRKNSEQNFPGTNEQFPICVTSVEKIARVRVFIIILTCVTLLPNIEHQIFFYWVEEIFVLFINKCHLFSCYLCIKSFPWVYLQKYKSMFR